MRSARIVETRDHGRERSEKAVDRHGQKRPLWRQASCFGHSGVKQIAASAGIDGEQKCAVVEVRPVAPSSSHRPEANNRVSGTKTIRTLEAHQTADEQWPHAITVGDSRIGLPRGLRDVLRCVLPLALFVRARRQQRAACKLAKLKTG